MEVIKINEDGNINIILKENESELAKAKCYLVNTPMENNEHIGTIGNIEIENMDYSKELFKQCEEVFKEKNIHTIVAPMNGNTWKQYRTLKSTTNEPMFLLENVSPIEFNSVLKESGFEECNLYTSNKGKISDAYYSEIIEIAKNNLEEENITIRKFNKENPNEDLTKIYNVSVQSFKRNPFYTDINKEEFIGQYTPYLSMIDNDLIMIAEKEGQEVGFVFCIPDYNEQKLYGSIHTLILKTIAVLPEYENLAIGNVMLNEIKNVAIKKGFEDWIFAFMYSNNTSQKMAKRNKAEIIREYALYRKEI